MRIGEPYLKRNFPFKLAIAQIAIYPIANKIPGEATS